MIHQPNAALLAAVRQEPEPMETRIAVTPMLRTICRSIYLSTFGRLNETERRYVLDVASGDYLTADFDRIAMAARRSARPANRQAIVDYVRQLAAENPESALPFERAMLRLAREQAESIVAVERFRFQRCPQSLDKAIDEVDDHRAALGDLKDSLVAERAKLAGASA